MTSITETTHAFLRLVSGKHRLSALSLYTFGWQTLFRRGVLMELLSHFHPHTTTRAGISARYSVPAP